jgi:thioredoxin-like negative regulator of GroEL
VYRFPGLIPFNALFLLPPLLLFSIPAAAQRRPPQPTPNPVPIPRTDTRESRRFSVSGHVSDAASHSRIEGVRVELHATNGGTVGSTFTRGNGDFEFDNIGEGVYNLTVEPMGYETVSQQVEVLYGPVFGIEFEVRRTAEASGAAPRATTKVSVRDLSIPQKARDAMEKGMGLLYGKSDYKGSLKQFDRAIQEYPEYYEAYAEMGVAYMRSGDTARSEQSLHKSLELSQEKYVEAFYLLATLFSNSKRFSEAEPLARKGVELDSNSWQANSELAHALLGLDRTTEAEASAVAAVKLEPNNAPLHLLLANVHMNEQNNPALLDDLNSYLKLAPTGPVADQARKQRDQVQQALSATQASPATTSPPKP